MQINKPQQISKNLRKEAAGMSSNLTAQRLRLLDWLKKRPITTIEARHLLDILGVAPRIYELRHWFGYNIKTFWITDFNPGGGQHKIAKYVLLPGKWQGGCHV